MRKIDFNSPDKTLQSVTKKHRKLIQFLFYLVESRYHKIIGMYRLNFKTLRFSSKKQILHNFAIIQSRKKIQKKKKKKFKKKKKNTNFAFINSLWKSKVMFMKYFIYTMRSGSGGCTVL